MAEGSEAGGGRRSEERGGQGAWAGGLGRGPGQGQEEEEALNPNPLLQSLGETSKRGSTTSPHTKP